jgi:hypothetical protein
MVAPAVRSPKRFVVCYIAVVVTLSLAVQILYLVLK